MVKPELWGPPLWIKLHLTTFKYPDAPTSEDKDQIIDFFKNIVPTMIPCEECIVNYNKKLQYFPVELNVDSKYDIVRWLINIHNQVNLATGKPMMAYKDAIALYENKTTVFGLNKVIIVIILLLILIIIKCRS